MSKLWSKRFTKANSKLMEEFNASIYFDRLMYEEDIAGSIAHTAMLHEIGILTSSEKNQITKGLKKINNKIANNELSFSASEEDIHTKVEQELKKEIGDLAGKLHTARSRNDQVNNDLRLFVRKHLIIHQKYLLQVMASLTKLAEEHQTVIMPGFTHLQPAQPITLSYYFLSYFFTLERDLARLQDTLKRINLSPLGSGAFAGVNYPVDRVMIQKSLGFDEILPNAMDAISDRDFVIEYASNLSLIMIHLSRISEEFILYSNQAFQFIEIDEAYSTGSSIMPNKKNPDSLELIRGKSGRVVGNLVSLLTIMKGLPLAYNKDLQEDKEGIMDSISTVSISLQVIKEVLNTLKINPKEMLAHCERGYLQATDIADYLVKKGLPFRNAHEVSASIVSDLSPQKKTYYEMNLADFKKYSPLFEDDIFKVIQMEAIIKNKKSVGSTSYSSVKKQLKLANQKIVKWKKMIRHFNKL